VLVSTNQSLDALDMADVIRVRDGRQPPGKIYSFMKSELLLYSSYRSSGIEMNCMCTYINLLIRRRKLVTVDLFHADKYSIDMSCIDDEWHAPGGQTGHLLPNGIRRS
jgi:hypothetical protein